MAGLKALLYPGGKEDILKEIVALEAKILELKTKWLTHSIKGQPTGILKPPPGDEEIEKDEKAIKRLANAIAEWNAKIEALNPDLDTTSKQIKDLWGEAAKLRREFGDKAWISEGLWKGLDFLSNKGVKEESDRLIEHSTKIADLAIKFDEELTDKKSTELQKRLAVEDKWAREQWVILTELQTNGIVSQQEFENSFQEILKASGAEKNKIQDEFRNTEREAQIKHQLALIDLAEQELRISKPEAIIQRIDQQEELLDIRETFLSTLDKVKDPAAWYAQDAAIDQTRDALLGLNLSMKEYTGTVLEGLIEGVNRYLRDAQTAFQGGLQIVADVTAGMKSAFDSFFDYTSDKFMDFKELILDILHDIYTAMMRSLIIEPFVKGIAGMFGTAGKIAGSGMTPEWAITAHGGGEIPQYIPRFHFGGLNPDERMTVSKVGERYISKEQNEWLTNMTKGGQTNVEVSVNVKNETGLPVKASTTGMKFDGKKYIKGVLLELEATDPVFMRRR